MDVTNEEPMEDTDEDSEDIADEIPEDQQKMDIPKEEEADEETDEETDEEANEEADDETDEETDEEVNEEKDDMGEGGDEEEGEEKEEEEDEEDSGDITDEIPENSKEQEEEEDGEDIAAEIPEDQKKNSIHAGRIEIVKMKNFILPITWTVYLHENLTFFTGDHNCGKTIIMKAIMLALGGQITQRYLGDVVCKSANFATIEIVLFNSGEKCYMVEKFGERIHLKRTIFPNGSSSYNVQLLNGQLQELDNYELRKILKNLGIFIDNPFVAVQQGTIRTIVHYENKMLYNFFIKSTPLEPLKEKCLENKTHADYAERHIKSQSQTLAQLNFELKELKKNIRIKKSLSKTREKLENLKTAIAWTKVSAAESFLANQNKKIMDCEENVQTIISEMEEFQKNNKKDEPTIKETKKYEKKLRQYGRRQRQAERQVRKAHREFKRGMKELKKHMDEAKTRSPEKVFNRRPLKEMEEEIEKLEKAIAIKDKISETNEELKTLLLNTKMYQDHLKINLQSLKEELKNLLQKMNTGWKQYNITRDRICNRADQHFRGFLNDVGLVGKLIFNHKEKSLTIEATPLRYSNTFKSLTWLSGGDTSLVAVAFLMSMWEGMEIPFAIIDSYNISPNQLYHQLTSKMLADFAKNRPGFQHIFFTPYSMKKFSFSGNILPLTS